MITIKNKDLTAKILLKGAEVLSVINNQNNNNYYWDKNPDIWNNTSPVLFPVVGKSNNNQIRYNDLHYPLNNHGFARHKVFNVNIIAEDEVSLRLTSKDIEKSEFPFEFKFYVSFKLIKNKLITTYKVENPSNNTIYFSLGAHPAFRCPFDSNHDFKDYYLEFSDSQDSTLIRHEINSQGLYTGEISEFHAENCQIDFSKFDISSTPVFSQFKSNYVSLIEKNSNRKITCSLNGFPYVAFWKKNEGNFLCIEPWCGKSDNVGFNGNFSEKEGIISLEPKKIFQISYTTEFSY